MRMKEEVQEKTLYVEFLVYCPEKMAPTKDGEPVFWAHVQQISHVPVHMSSALGHIEGHNMVKVTIPLKTNVVVPREVTPKVEPFELAPDAGSDDGNDASK